MPDAVEQEVIRKLRERVARGNLAGITVMYQISGGAPGEQAVYEEVRLSGTGDVRARVHTVARTFRERTDTIPRPAMKDVLQQLGDGVSDLIPRSEARFIPDSMIGRITLEIDGQEASFFFLADEEQAKQSGQVLSVKAARAIASLSRLHERILRFP